MFKDGLINRLKELSMAPGGSLGVFALGLLVQIVLYPLAIVVVVKFGDNPVIEPIILGVMTLIFFLPLVGIYGIIVGAKCYKRKMGRLLPIFGVIMNTLWFALLVFACYLVFVLKVTV